MDDGLVLLIIQDIVLGWFYLILMMVSVMVLRGSLRSRDNYRPWRPFAIPEDLADRVNRQGAKWMLALSVFAIGLLIVQTVYGALTGDYEFVLAAILLPIALLLVLIVGVYLQAWRLLRRRNAGGTR